MCSLWTHVVVLVLLVPGLARQVGAQPEGPSTVDNWHFRFDLFQMLFEQSGLRPIQDVTLASANPGETVIVCLGKLPLPSFQNRFHAFLRRGGALLMASDQAVYFDRRFLIESGPATAISEEDMYQGHWDCLRIRQLDPTHPLTEGVTEIIANRTGWFAPRQLERSNWQVVARLPRRTTRADSREQALVILRGSLAESASRLIAVADHSLFTNGMLWHGDNALFAINVSRALCDSGRKQVLFLVDGKPQNSYLVGPLADQLPLPGMDSDYTPELGWDQKLQVANSMLSEIEDSNVLNRLLVNQPRIPEQYYRRGLFFAIAAIMIVFCIWKLTARARRATPPLAAPVRPTAALSRPSNSPQTRSRTPEDHGQAAMILARNFCQEMTASADAVLWQQQLSAKAVAALGVQLPTGVGDKLASIVSLARRPKASPMAGNRLLELSHEIDLLRSLLVDHRPQRPENQPSQEMARPQTG